MSESDSADFRLENAVAFLRQNLGKNLYSLVLYGSAARGAFVEGRSDINLMIVLEASTPESHLVLREMCIAHLQVDPFVVERAGMPRAAQVFGLKFLSIARNHRLLAGQDPFSDLQISQPLQVLLAEQECRNLRMRLTRAFVTAGSNARKYERFLISSAPRFFIVLSDVARCAGVELPRALSERAAVFAKTFGTQVEALEYVWRCHKGADKLVQSRHQEVHAGLIPLLSAALKWMEKQWPKLPM